jgi:hypothetical protein
MIPNSANPVVDRLILEGQNSVATLLFEHDATATVSSLQEVVVKQFANYELNDGKIVTPQFEVQANGALTGSGILDANVVAGITPLGGGEASVSPGLSATAVGTLDVNGNLQLGDSAKFMIDVEGDTAGQFDTVNVSGALELGGTLRIDATSLTMPVAGTTFDLITAGSLDEGEIFDFVETIGNDDIFFAPIYTPLTPGSGSDIGGGGTIETRVAVGVYNNGDMNRNGLIDTPDVQAFALALTKPNNYFGSFYIFGSESGDLNHDGRLDFDDIEFFAALMQGTGATSGDIARAIERELAVPEPGALLLASLAICILAARLPKYR